MYLHLGQNEIVSDHRIIGIFDLDKCSYGKRTRDYLAAAEESRLQLYLAVQEAEDRMNARIRAMRADSKWIVRGNPTMRSAKYRRAGEELRRRLKKR